MLRQQWLATGRADVPPEAIDESLWEEVAAEADRCEQYAVVRHNQRPGLLAMRDGSITSPPSGAGSTPAGRRSTPWRVPRGSPTWRPRRPVTPR